MFKIKTISFAADVAVIIMAAYLEEVTQLANLAFATIRRWLSKRGLQLPDHKSDYSSDKQRDCGVLHSNCWSLRHNLTTVTAIPGWPERHHATI